MKVLGISTATKYISAGLIDGNKVISQFTSASQRSEDLVILLERIFREAGLDIKDIDAISVAQGPGSYSGLRGGLAAAKSLSQVLNIPIVGVSTLEAMAYNLVNVEGTIVSVMDAVREELNLAMFTSDSKELTRITGDIVVKEKRLKGLLDDIKGEIFVVTNVEEIKKAGRNIRFADDAHSMASGVNVACVGLKAISSGKTGDFLTLVPKYSHMPKLKEYSA